MNQILRLILPIAMIGLSATLAISERSFLHVFGILMAFLTSLWIIGLVIKDASIIDIFWGLGYVIMAWFYYFVSLGPGSFSPIFMTFLLLRISGVALLEKSLEETKPADKEYIEKKLVFIPWFPKN